MAGCSTHRTDPLEPGGVQQQRCGQNTLPDDVHPTEDGEVVGRLKELRDTLQAQFSDLANMTDRTLEQPSAKLSMLKNLHESLTRKLHDLIRLDNQMRDLLDIESFEMDYEESD